MFNENELSRILRTGTLPGYKIERGTPRVTYTKEKQIKTLPVKINGDNYKIIQTFPYKENKNNVNKGGHPPEITLYYELKPLEAIKL